MRTIRRIVMAACAAAIVATPATAEAKSVRQTYTDYRVAVVHKHGARAAGRNIRRYGVVKGSKTRRATRQELLASIAVLRRILHPPVYLHVSRVGPPSNPPSGAYTANYAPSGVAACIVSRESGGDPNATNGQYHGIAQWSPEAWRRMGGRKYASDPVNASYQEQLQVLSDGIREYGTRDWSAYDGC